MQRLCSRGVFYFPSGFDQSVNRSFSSSDVSNKQLDIDSFIWSGVYTTTPPLPAHFRCGWCLGGGSREGGFDAPRGRRGWGGGELGARPQAEDSWCTGGGMTTAMVKKIPNLCPITSPNLCPVSRTFAPSLPFGMTSPAASPPALSNSLLIVFYPPTSIGW